ncbi:MAG: hypothetical protein AAF127_16520 [Pseudomonadota bacterium]
MKLPETLRAAIAQQLEEVATEAEELGTVLALDEAVITGHIEQLQRIDRMAQSVRGLASVIAAKEPEAAVHQVTLSALKDALSAALFGESALKECTADP